ncbi:acyltransferase family protein [Brucella anthropi]|uniref:acyltransferase family protein n=1 Tax=Brucella anthropi TaxID=529 RepID=UPI001CFE498A|nr:acyltransferase [Brucella anthropi]
MHQRTISPKSDYSKATTLNSIQLLRAVACLMVVIHHALSLVENKYVAVGAAGVDVFFVISGFVMVIATKANESSVIFIKKRFIKVVPMYWIATVLTIIFYYYRHGEIIVWEHIATSLLFLPPPEHLIVPVLYPGWSLNYEMFFYLIIAIALLSRKNTFLYVIVVVCALGSLGHKTGIHFIDYYIYDGLLEFCAGVVIGITYKHGVRISQTAGVFLFTCAILIFSVNYSYPTISKAIYWGIPSVLIVVAFLTFEKSGVARNVVGLEIGAASYTMYLFHPFVIWSIEWQFGNQPGIFFVIGAVVTSVVISLVLYRLLEAPLNKGLRKLAISSARVNT